VFGPLYAERFAGLNVVTTNHGPFNAELHDLYSRIVPRVPILCVSHDQASCAGEIPVARVIHHGIDATDFPMGDGSGGYLLFLGRMAEEKGPHRAIEVARKARMPLRMAAKMREPWERAFFDTEVEPYLNDDIRYLGEVPHDEKLALIADAAALLNPIRWHEPFGLVMTEALACGTPVIAFREGAAPEIIEHGVTGFLCADEAEMVDAVRRLHEIDRAACRAAVEHYFSTARMVQEHIEFYEQVLAG
jgi:glycosyltransferase involved in cell wall biosynthesis